jgi:hypothetical protein
MSTGSNNVFFCVDFFTCDARPVNRLVGPSYSSEKYLPATLRRDFVIAAMTIGLSFSTS